MKVLVTGSRGFIGSAFIRESIKEDRFSEIIAFSRNTNEFFRDRLEDNSVLKESINSGKLKIVYGDLNSDISGLCEKVNLVVHFAAKTFVDHSVKDPVSFVQSNTVGTLNLLEEARKQKVDHFITISTDEVYGEAIDDCFSEKAALNPRNIYAASKASADMITQSYCHTFGMWTAVTRTENNYGEFQHYQKAMPTFISKALRDEKIPVYGDGQQIRQWLYVNDHVQGIFAIIDNMGRFDGGEIWNIAGNEEISNLGLAKLICSSLNKDESLIEFIDDSLIRPGHDKRYCVLSDKLRSLGWKPTVNLHDGLKNLIDWYDDNKRWLLK